MKVSKGIWQWLLAVTLMAALPQLSVATHRDGHNPPGLEDNDPPGQANARENQGSENAQSNRNNVLFRLQDKVIRFDLDGSGVQVGTATGRIEGVSITQFKFTLTPNNPNFSFDNRAGITDTDGDQIIFRVLGAGRFVIPPLKESPSTPAANEVLGGLGGPVGGTYEVLAVSGKYVGKYKVGEKFPFQAVGYNPNPASMPAGQALGASYVEVFSNSDRDEDEEDDD